MVINCPMLLFNGIFVSGIILLKSIKSQLTSSESGLDKVAVVQLTLVTGIKPTVPLSAIDKENSLESSLHWSVYLYTIHLVCALIIPHSQPNYV